MSLGITTGYCLQASLNTDGAAVTLRERRLEQSVLKLQMKYNPNLRSQLLSLRKQLSFTCTLPTLSMLCQRAKQQSIHGVGMSAADTAMHMNYITIGCCQCLGEGLVKM